MSKDFQSKPQRKTYTFSIRLTKEEQLLLEKRSVGMSKSDYGKLCLFGKDAVKVRTRGKHPVKDHALLSRILATLGGSRIANNLNQIAHAANCGALMLNPELQSLLIKACADIREIKTMLMKALGLGI